MASKLVISRNELDVATAQSGRKFLSLAYGKHASIALGGMVRSVKRTSRIRNLRPKEKRASRNCFRKWRKKSTMNPSVSKPVLAVCST